MIRKAKSLNGRMKKPHNIFSPAEAEIGHALASCWDSLTSGQVLTECSLCSISPLCQARHAFPASAYVVKHRPIEASPEKNSNYITTSTCIICPKA